MKNKKIKFVDVKRFGFVTEPRYYLYGWSRSPKILGRLSAVKALAKAHKFLPKKYNFKIWDCRRPLAVQIKMLNSFRHRIKKLYPKASIKERMEILDKFGGKALKIMKCLDTHRKGGAFDLTIIDGLGKEIFMGTDHDDLTTKAALDYYEKKKQLSLSNGKAKKNRRLLKKAMTKANFKNYAPEWWHWSYDK